MPDKSFLVILPDGRTMGPLSPKLLRELVIDGEIPREAELRCEGKVVSLTEALTGAEERRRMSPELRAQLGGTQASTPKALLAAKKTR